MRVLLETNMSVIKIVVGAFLALGLVGMAVLATVEQLVAGVVEAARDYVPLIWRQVWAEWERFWRA